MLLVRVGWGVIGLFLVRGLGGDGASVGAGGLGTNWLVFWCGGMVGMRWMVVLAGGVE
ncbi:hypothetical protein [Paenibacillus plantarum]|uniref:hypothetical protein n=1 Tax=Paenibacillus plantarum TaxID=2654975 RepID=UPI0014924B35|nr:hypothetical protein [Paenibacillus plantarum]